MGGALQKAEAKVEQKEVKSDDSWSAFKKIQNAAPQDEKSVYDIASRKDRKSGRDHVEKKLIADFIPEKFHRGYMVHLTAAAKSSFASGVRSGSFWYRLEDLIAMKLKLRGVMVYIGKEAGVTAVPHGMINTRGIILRENDGNFTKTDGKDPGQRQSGPDEYKNSAVVSDFVYVVVQ